MTISRELMTAIFSMDAYNRGYDAGIDDGKDTALDGLGEDVKIGDATVLRREDINITQQTYEEWQAAGFYAVAYDWNGQTVISYRGTDSIFSAPWSNDPGSDGWNGYPLGAGYPLSTQAKLAAQFFQSVTGTTGLENPRLARPTSRAHIKPGNRRHNKYSIFQQRQ